MKTIVGPKSKERNKKKKSRSKKRSTKYLKNTRRKQMKTTR
jgi:hypothetical protein